MATLTFGKSHFTIGAYGNQSQVREQERPSFMSNVCRFMESAQVLADRYTDYKYNETD
jgi:hypothetical protein